LGAPMGDERLGVREFQLEAVSHEPSELPLDLLGFFPLSDEA
jgi:hypothetical protein